tara:strand:+ start:1493 stop:1918 length:426 start_codon:yes stop_codon:yes gene_type:complete
MRDVKVCYVDGDDNDRVKFGFNGASAIADQRSTLVQRVFKLLLTKTASSTYDAAYGSSFGDVIGSHFSVENFAEVTAFLKLGISTVEKLILDEQLNSLVLTPAGRLKEITILRIEEDIANLGWAVTISIISEDGRAYIARI